MYTTRPWSGLIVPNRLPNGTYSDACGMQHMAVSKNWGPILEVLVIRSLLLEVCFRAPDFGKLLHLRSLQSCHTSGEGFFSWYKAVRRCTSVLFCFLVLMVLLITIKAKRSRRKFRGFVEQPCTLPNVADDDQNTSSTNSEPSL